MTLDLFGTRARQERDHALRMAKHDAAYIDDLVAKVRTDTTHIASLEQALAKCEDNATRLRGALDMANEANGVLIVNATEHGAIIELLRTRIEASDAKLGRMQNRDAVTGKFVGAK